MINLISLVKYTTYQFIYISFWEKKIFIYGKNIIYSVIMNKLYILFGPRGFLQTLINNE